MKVLIIFNYDTYLATGFKTIQSSRMVECDSSDDIWKKFNQVTSGLRNAVFTCYVPENRKPFF